MQSIAILEQVKNSTVNILLLTSLLLSSNSTASISQQRQLFVEAEQALRDRKPKLFSRLTDQLVDYPVVAYLKHDELKSRLGRAKAKEVSEFLEEYKNYPFAYHLRGRWLRLLAKRGKWSDYLSFYDDRKSAKYKCLEITAKLKTQQLDGLNKDIKKLWLTGYSQPDECDLPFSYFLNSNDKEVLPLVWERIEKAFKARRSSLALFLARNLDKKDQKIVKTWYYAHRNPEKYLKKLIRYSDSPINRKVIIHTIKRLARKKSLDAQKHWSKFNQKFKFSKAQIDSVNKKIALSTAYQHKPEAKQLLENLPDDLKTDNAYIWLARINLRDEDWIGLVRTIEEMPDRIKEEAEWIYWLARAYAETGLHSKAETIYEQLSTRGSYYGFLAADKVQKPYQIKQQHAVSKASFDESELLGNNINLLRARELFYLNRLLEARREWFQGIRKLDQTSIKQAATMASAWKWHDNAIKTVAKTPHREDYNLRFPMPYRSLVMSNVDKHKLDPSIIYSVMRRESLFDPLAKSRVGALGLMQLMPATARSVAKKLGLKRPRQYDILNVKNNIKLGTQYFKTVLGRFDNNVSLAAAAYNAGPSNVKRWLPKGESLAADQWVETVPFKETRHYVKAILAYATVFDKHLNKSEKISNRMADIKSSY